MDRATIKKMKEAQSKAIEQMEKQKKAQDPNNKEFWEAKKESLEQYLKKLDTDRIDAELVLQAYLAKLGTF